MRWPGRHTPLCVANQIKSVDFDTEIQHEGGPAPRRRQTAGRAPRAAPAAVPVRRPRAGATPPAPQSEPGRGANPRWPESIGFRVRVLGLRGPTFGRGANPGRPRQVCPGSRRARVGWRRMARAVTQTKPTAGWSDASCVTERARAWGRPRVQGFGFRFSLWSLAFPGHFRNHHGPLKIQTPLQHSGELGRSASAPEGSGRVLNLGMGQTPGGLGRSAPAPEGLGRVLGSHPCAPSCGST
jgi:hypothetical protein